MTLKNLGIFPLSAKYLNKKKKKKKLEQVPRGSRISPAAAISYEIFIVNDNEGKMFTMSVSEWHWSIIPKTTFPE